jgi:outer membrane biosynthesis protein TonB
MRILLLTVLLTILTHTTSAEEITTGNLLPNAGDGVDWNSSSTDQINPGSSGYVSNNATMNGFTVTCPTSQSNCGYKWSVGGDFEVTGTTTLSKNDIALTNTDRTQEMLDNGITLNNYIDVANCDHEAGNCEGDSGNTDSHTVTIKLKNSSGTILSTTTQTRTDIDGFKGNCNGYPTSSSAGVSAACGQYNDRVIYNSTGSNKVDWSWSGTDNNTGSASRGGPNLLGAKLTMTYDNTVLDEETSDALDDVEDTLDDLQEEVFNDMEEFYFEEEYFTFNEEPQFEMEMEMETFTLAEEFIEDFFMEMDEEFFMEEENMSFEDGPMFTFADDEMMEEIYEETNEIVATFLPMVSEEEELSYEESFIENDGPIFMEPTEDGEGFTTETFQEEELMEEEPMMTETFQEEEMMEEEEMVEEMPEESTEMAEEEVMEEENTEMAEEEAIEEEPTEMVQATNEEEKEEVKEEKSDSETPKKSTVQSKKLAKQKKIQQKKAIVKNLDRIMDKVDKDIKDISKNLAVKNIIKMEAMTSEQASLNAYANTAFYKPKDIYLDQLNIFDYRQLYPNTNLASYTQNDKIEIKARKLQEINSRKQKLLMELEILKNG